MYFTGEQDVKIADPECDRSSAFRVTMGPPLFLPITGDRDTCTTAQVRFRPLRRCALSIRSVTWKNAFYAATPLIRQPAKAARQTPHEPSVEA